MNLFKSKISIQAEILSSEAADTTKNHFHKESCSKMLQNGKTTGKLLQQKLVKDSRGVQQQQAGQQGCVTLSMLAWFSLMMEAWASRSYTVRSAFLEYRSWGLNSSSMNFLLNMVVMMSFITAKTKRLCGLLHNSEFLVHPSCKGHTGVTCAEQGQSTAAEGELHLWILHCLSPTWPEPAHVPQGTNATWAGGSSPCFPVGIRLALLPWFYSYSWHFSLLNNIACRLLWCVIIEKSCSSAS